MLYNINMNVIVRKSEKPVIAFRKAKGFVGSKRIIGIRTRALVKIDEKHFEGVSNIHMSGDGTTLQKLNFLFGSTAEILSCEEGRMEICISA